MQLTGLQVGALRHKRSDAPAEDREALRSVEHIGRSALAEMRGLLAAMRRDGEDGQPGFPGGVNSGTAGKTSSNVAPWPLALCTWTEP